MKGAVSVSPTFRGGTKRTLRWARRLVALAYVLGGTLHGWDGGVDTVHGSDAVGDSRPGVGGRLRRFVW